jgi:hypothetical protein
MLSQPSSFNPVPTPNELRAYASRFCDATVRRSEEEFDAFMAASFSEVSFAGATNRWLLALA